MIRLCRTTAEICRVNGRVYPAPTPRAWAILGAGRHCRIIDTIQPRAWRGETAFLGVGSRFWGVGAFGVKQGEFNRLGLADRDGWGESSRRPLLEWRGPGCANTPSRQDGPDRETLPPLRSQRGNTYRVRMIESIRCGNCRRLLARASGFSSIEIKCPRCGAITIERATRPEPERRIERPEEKDVSCRAGLITDL